MNYYVWKEQEPLYYQEVEAEDEKEAARTFLSDGYKNVYVKHGEVDEFSVRVGLKCPEFDDSTYTHSFTGIVTTRLAIGVEEFDNE